MTSSKKAVTAGFKAELNAHSMCVQESSLYTPYRKWI
jgi:hypothetical protein